MVLFLGRVRRARLRGNEELVRLWVRSEVAVIHHAGSWFYLVGARLTRD